MSNKPTRVRYLRGEIFCSAPAKASAVWRWLICSTRTACWPPAARTSRASHRRSRPSTPHFKPRAKNVISLFMCGGVSHLDTFDPKPALDKYHGQPLPAKARFRFSRAIPDRSCAARTSSRSTGNRASRSPSCSRTWRRLSMTSRLIRSAVGRSNDHSLSHFEWNTGAMLAGLSELRRVGHLRTRHREPEPARLRRDLRSPRRPLQRTE